MDKSAKIWIRAMYLFDKYWGCHQIPERSFFIKGFQLPVCARCTGIILGEILFILFIAFGLRFQVLLGFIFIVPLILDGTIQYFTKYLSNNCKRLITGLLFGFGFFNLIFNLISFFTT